MDALVDSAMGHEIFCFLDAFKGYHQIGMSEEDQEKTVFYTDQGVYFYTTMPFGLKNAGVTYQRLINRLFKDQIGRNVEAYVDDILVRSLTTSAFLSDVREVFGVLRVSRMKLNPKKCVFGVTSEKFLGYLVSRRGIETNPDKVKAIQDMSPPRNLREVQRLNGRLAALNRFLSQFAEKALPFFKVLKKADQFTWTDECQAAFDKLKQYLHHLPTLASPRPEKKLYLYLSAADEAISAMLIRDNDTQVPVYYDRPAYSTDTGATRGFRAPYQVGRRVRGVSYESRTAIKAQAIADFLAELTFTEGRESTSAIAEMFASHSWTLYVDGSSNGDDSGAGLLLEGPQGEVCSYALRFDFPATNNEAEYEALIAGLQLARRLCAQRIHVRSDSQLVICQVLGEYEAKDETMQRYLSKIHQLTAYFESFEIQRILRSQNRRADALSRLASTSFSDLNKTVLVEVLSEPGYMEELACPCPVVLSDHVEISHARDPFSLTYGIEAVIPVEILTPSPRLAAYAAEVNEEERLLDLNLVDERRDIASARIASYKNTLTHYYNARVKHRRFQPSDLVLRKNSVSRTEPQGKLCPKWEGPYRVVESNLSRYCKLSYRDGSLVPRTWHAENLKLYYA
ncbi:uncharacterized protein LOC113777216 [Coffea eugenioides]|uniref:uncharacterized protein LOC113777216 n=1 Tax=Coffea eugenioides TaxID=49369 RepID=UPI000F612C3A|nr:uncharacterized protein LOC113777216 [Coffea eugenioides]